VEVAYHDNLEDANWIKNNVQPIARALSRSLAEYFGIPFVEPVG
jgi:N-acetylmuramoyl-L-alanine amidase